MLQEISKDRNSSSSNTSINGPEKKEIQNIQLTDLEASMDVDRSVTVTSNDPMHNVIINLLSIILPVLKPPTLKLLLSASITPTLPSGNQIVDMDELDLLHIFIECPHIFPFPRLDPQTKSYMKDMVRVRERGGRRTMTKGDVKRLLEKLNNCWMICDENTQREVQMYISEQLRMIE
jgi:hypothetical protein